MYGEAIRTGRKPAHNIGDTIMNMTITVDTNINVAQLLKGVEPEDLGLDKYKYIMNSVNNVNVSSDKAFQRKFNGFYVVRRDRDTRGKAYYEYFEKNKNNKNLTFADIINHIYNTADFYTEKGKPRLEMSFSSKMLATIQPDKPIWDSRVCNFLGIGQPNNIARAIQRYADLENWYNSFLQTQDANNWIAAFDNAFPEYKWISRTKKIDFIIWCQER